MGAWKRLWARLSYEQRKVAAREFLAAAEGHPGSVHSTIQLLANETKTRPEVVERWSLDKRADRLSRALGLGEHDLSQILATYLVQSKQPMLLRFLDVAEIPNVNAVFDPRAFAEPVSVERLAAGIRAIRAEFPPSDGSLYLDALEAQGGIAMEHLPVARRSARAEASPAAPPAPAPAATAATEAATGSAPPGPPPPAQEPTSRPAAPAAMAAESGQLFGSDPYLVNAERLTPLDTLLTDAMVATAVKVAGSPSFDRLRSIVEELMSLTAARHRSAFHLGFLDVIEGRGTDPASTQSGERARGWYVTGAVHALARRGDSAGIAALLDDHASAMRRLLGDRHEACGVAVASIFDALCEAGRRADAVAALVPMALCRGGAPFFERLLGEAATLLRASRAADATPIVHLLVDGLDLLRRRGTPPRAGLAEEVALQRALAHRLHGGFDRAAEVLAPVADSPVAAFAARARSDLGLVACRIRSLSEVRLPPSATDLPATARALAPGLSEVRRGSVTENPHRAQADYVLGVHALASGEVEAARVPLERATARLLGGDAVAEGSGVLGWSRLCLSLALAESLELGRAEEALDHLVAGAERVPAELPPWLVSRALTAFATMRPDLGARAVDALYGVLGDRLLDAASASGLLTAHETLRETLARRVEDPRRSRRARGDDAVVLLRDALVCSDIARAVRALSALEDLADDAEGRARLLALLADRGRYDPAWEVAEANDVRVRLLEAEGRYPEAAALLTLAAHEALSKDVERGLPLAIELLERVDSYGIDRPDAGLTARIEALRRAGTLPMPGPGRPSGRVYFVGGNEVQARYEPWLREEAARRWPGVLLEFDFAGWSSNWGRVLPTIDGHIREAGAVVVMRFIRTMLGRAVREGCGRHGRPWIPCTGHGRDSLLGAIGRAVALLPTVGA